MSQIPANPGQVCLQHAVEFWTGLLTYARQQQSESSETLDSHATCAVCMELTAARTRMLAAIDEPSPETQPAAMERVTPERLVSKRVAADQSVPDALRLASRRAPSALTISTTQWGGISESISR